MNAVIQGVLIGSGLSIFGQVITQLFKLKSIKIEKHHDRLDLIFKKRMEAYSEMNFKLYELDKAVGLKKIQEFEKLYLGITAYWGRVCVYMPPTVSMKILKVINYSTLNFADPDSEDIGQYNQILKEAKDALQELEDINWLPTS